MIVCRYLVARSMKRKLVFHAGPTNSGKTHHALQHFLKAYRGVYCAPLRMLAHEIAERSNKEVCAVPVSLSVCVGVHVQVDCKRHLKSTSVDSQGQHSSVIGFSVFLFVCLSVCFELTKVDAYTD